MYDIIFIRKYKEKWGDELKNFKLNQEIADVVEKKIEKVIRRLLTEYEGEKKQTH